MERIFFREFDLFIVTQQDPVRIEMQIKGEMCI